MSSHIVLDASSKHARVKMCSPTLSYRGIVTSTTSHTKTLSIGNPLGIHFLS
jgi:sulfur relay (sulfurtransferase) complex TusBCD TusD component (DsrE family)